MDDEICQKSQAPAFHPVETQTSATAVLQAALGCVQDLLPFPPLRSWHCLRRFPVQCLSLLKSQVASLVYEAPVAYTQSAPALVSFHVVY
jgi:hypothetical protein